MKGTFQFLKFIPGKVQFIRSQKKQAQLVYNGYIYNKKLTLANGDITWRCSDVSKKRCGAVCVTRNNNLTSVRRGHQHDPHWKRIFNRPLFNEENDSNESYAKTEVVQQIEVFPRNEQQHQPHQQQNQKIIPNSSSNNNSTITTMSLADFRILVEMNEPIH